MRDQHALEQLLRLLCAARLPARQLQAERLRHGPEEEENRKPLDQSRWTSLKKRQGKHLLMRKADLLSREWAVCASEDTINTTSGRHWRMAARVITGEDYQWLVEERERGGDCPQRKEDPIKESEGPGESCRYTFPRKHMMPTLKKRPLLKRMALKFIPKCSSKLQTGFKFCLSCGEKLPSLADTAQLQSSPLPKKVQQMEQTGEAPRSPQGRVRKLNRQRKLDDVIKRPKTSSKSLAAREKPGTQYCQHGNDPAGCTLLEGTLTKEM
ncbi:hypothetical protein AAFF_G00227620 [Aldrovandia affinis]|uniref:Uncharacterized protein n=1 Tax=Aldrovandia affinis TaxID=143900 RepID=A0AAD7TBK2_9TELE|nr:hypothetical protein AAFF_G00227620 [Aldrovandia affinis]